MALADGDPAEALRAQLLEFAKVSSSKGLRAQLLNPAEALRAQQPHSAVTNITQTPPPKHVCEVCQRVYPRETIPFRWCNYCWDSPSWHHGRCCPWNPQAQVSNRFPRQT